MEQLIHNFKKLTFPIFNGNRKNINSKTLQKYNRMIQAKKINLNKCNIRIIISQGMGIQKKYYFTNKKNNRNFAKI
jgi:hypothetical protein